MLNHNAGDRRLLIATTNAGKVRELAQLFANTSLRVVSLDQLTPPLQSEVEETGATYQENALLKAEGYANMSQMVTVADDSGFEVQSLGNKPGVQSARWMAGTDDDKNTALLKLLRDQSDRSARFVCSLCLYEPETAESHCFTGTLEGTVAYEPTGDDGFGYDPIFIPNGYTQSLASLGRKVKNSISHRAVALAQLRTYLQQRGWL